MPWLAFQESGNVIAKAKEPCFFPPLCEHDDICLDPGSKSFEPWQGAERQDASCATGGLLWSGQRSPFSSVGTHCPRAEAALHRGYLHHLLTKRHPKDATSAAVGQRGTGLEAMLYRERWRLKKPCTGRKGLAL